MDKMGGVIIITGNFPPKHNSVGKMIRTVTLASYLASSGYDVHVVAIDRKIDMQFYKMELINLNPDVNVYFAKDVWQQINQIKKKYSLIARVIGYVYRKMSPYDIFLLNRIKKITTKIIDTNSVKNIIISTPPGKLQLLSPKLRKIYGDKINIIADYRDAWSFRKEDVKGLSVKELLGLHKIEQSCLHANSMSVFVTKAMHRCYHENFSIGNYEIIENGFIRYDENSSGSVPENYIHLIKNLNNQGRLIIAYAGTGSVVGDGNKDFKPLIDLIASDHRLRTKISFLLFGEVKGIDKYSGLVDYHSFSFIPNNTIHKYLNLSDIGLFIHSEPLEAPMVMGGKTYDYIASSVPIWFIVPENANSIHNFIKNHKKGYLSDIYSPDSIVSELNKILHDHSTSQLSKHTLTKNESLEYDRNVIYEKFKKILVEFEGK